MTTLKERFEEEFGRGKFFELAVLSFFRQELLALAEEVETLFTMTPDSSSDFASRGNNIGIKYAASLIRSKADELN